MNRHEVLDRLRAAGVVPVLRAQTADEALALADALVAGGCSVLELTLTTPGALAALAKLAARPGLCVGAGSVLGTDRAAEALRAGARFIVSPVLDVDVVVQCRARGTAVLPGALTPGEIVRAWDAGADLVKVFPVSAVGGPAYLRALRGPLPQVSLMPTGGVTLESLPDYFAAGAVAVGVGSELADAAAIRRGDADTVTATTQAWLRAAKAARS